MGTGEHSDERLSRREVVVWSLVLAACFFVAMLLGAGGDPLAFAALGNEHDATSAYILDELGRESTTAYRPDQGHDGRFFLLQAWDPLLIDTTYAERMDRPTYRAQRGLFPMLVGFGGFAPKAAVPLLIGLVNVAAIGFGAWVTSSLARCWNRPVWLGLAFTLNPAVLAEFGIGGAGVVGLAAAMFALWRLAVGDELLAAVGFALACLSRESFCLFVLGAVLFYWWSHRSNLSWRRLALPVPAVVATATWGLYVRWRLDAGSGAGEVRELGWPFKGVLEAAALWPESSPGEWLLTGLALATLGTYLCLGLTRRWNLATAGAFGFFLLALGLTVYVWHRPFDIWRAIGPVFLAVALAPSRAHSPTPAKPQPDGTGCLNHGIPCLGQPEEVRRRAVGGLKN